MCEMTTIEAIKELHRLKEDFENFNYGLSDKNFEALDKAIEVMKESVTNKVTEKHRESFKPNYEFIDEEEKECQHPYHMVHSTCMGEINKCYQCGEDL